MFTPVELFLAWRYTRARRRSQFVSLISAISIAGVALGIAALITILSIMNGFERELRERILGMAAHLTISAQAGPLADWQTLADLAHEARDVIGVAPYVSGEALMTRLGAVQGARIEGVLPAAEASVSVLQSRMRRGDFGALAPGSFAIVLGRGLADALRADVGTDVTLLLPEPIRTAAGILPRLKRFHVVGIFEAGVQEYDTATAFVHMDDAARMFRLRGGVSGLRIKLADAFAVARAEQALRALPQFADHAPTLAISDWTATHTNLFRALKVEKIVMFVILLLSVGVAAFNLVSTLVMVVAEKHTEVAVLRTLGMTSGRILRVFIAQGALIGFAGIALGTALGITLAVNVETIVAGAEQLFHFKILSPDVYYISEIPSELEAADVAAALLLSVVLCLAAPLYPAWAASRTNPAEALRYE